MDGAHLQGAPALLVTGDLVRMHVGQVKGEIVDRFHLVHRRPNRFAIGADEVHRLVLLRLHEIDVDHSGYAAAIAKVDEVVLIATEDFLNLAHVAFRESELKHRVVDVRHDRILVPVEDVAITTILDLKGAVGEDGTVGAGTQMTALEPVKALEDHQHNRRPDRVVIRHCLVEVVQQLPRQLVVLGGNEGDVHHGHRPEERTTIIDCAHG